MSARPCDYGNCLKPSELIGTYTTQLGEKRTEAACSPEHALEIEKRLKLPEGRMTWLGPRLTGPLEPGRTIAGMKAFESDLLQLLERHGVTRIVCAFTDPDRRDGYIARLINKQSGAEWTAAALFQLSEKAQKMMENGDLI